MSHEAGGRAVWVMFWRKLSNSRPQMTMESIEQWGKPKSQNDSTTIVTVKKVNEFRLCT